MYTSKMPKYNNNTELCNIRTPLHNILWQKLLIRKTEYALSGSNIMIKTELLF